MERVKNFNDVKIGDEFVRSGRYGYASGEKELVNCTHITPKQVMIGGYKYRKHDASGIGGSTYHGVPALYVVTPEERAEIQMNLYRKYISAINTRVLTDDQVQRIYNIVKELK